MHGLDSTCKSKHTLLICRHDLHLNWWGISVRHACPPGMHSLDPTYDDKCPNNLDTAKYKCQVQILKHVPNFWINMVWPFVNNAWYRHHRNACIGMIQNMQCSGYGFCVISYLWWRGSRLYLHVCVSWRKTRPVLHSKTGPRPYWACIIRTYLHDIGPPVHIPSWKDRTGPSQTWNTLATTSDRLNAGLERSRHGIYNPNCHTTNLGPLKELWLVLTSPINSLGVLHEDRDIIKQTE